MSRFAIVIDGTAALPEDLAQAHEIRWLPLKVILSDQAFVAATSCGSSTGTARIGTSAARPRRRSVSATSMMTIAGSATTPSATAMSACPGSESVRSSSAICSTPPTSPTAAIVAASAISLPA